MDDCISRQAAIEAFDGVKVDEENCIEYDIGYNDGIDFAVSRLSVLPAAQPEIIRCKDCKFYSPMNRETKTGICNLIMHQNFGDNWFCAGAERRPDENR